MLRVLVPFTASFVVLFAILTVPFAAEARWQTMKESDSVIEKFVLNYDVKKSGAYSEYIEYVVRVQAEDAKSSAGVFRIEYNGVTDKLKILNAYTQNGDKKIPVDPSNIEDRDKGEARDYDVQRIRAVTFPQVKIGSLLHVRYKITVTKPVVQNRWSTDIGLAPGVFVKDFEMKVTSEVPLFDWLQDPMHLVKVSQPQPKELVVHNIRPIPGWVHGEKNPYFSPINTTQLWISTEKDWRRFMKPFEDNFDEVLAAGAPKELAPWLAEARKQKTPQEQILFLLDKMSRDFRYFGDWRRLNGSVVPRQLKDIAHSRYGDCKDLATLLTSLLRALKIDAHVALVRRGGNPYGHEPDYQLPAMDHFNHAIVAARVGEHTYWLDATNPVGALEPYMDIAGRPAWILAVGGGHFARVPEAEPAAYGHRSQYEYRFLKGDNVKVEVHADLKGMAAFRPANDLMTLSHSDFLTSTLDYFSEGQDVRSFHYVHEPTTSRTLHDVHFDLDYQASGVTYHAGHDRFFVIPDGLLSGVFYETKDRESDMRLYDEPMSFTGERRLKNVKLEQRLPEPCHVDSRWMDLSRQVKVEGHDVVIRQKIDLKRPYITHQEFRTPAFQRLQAATKRCFYRSGLLINALK